MPCRRPETDGGWSVACWFAAIASPGGRVVLLVVMNESSGQERSIDTRASIVDNPRIFQKSSILCPYPVNRRNQTTNGRQDSHCSTLYESVPFRDRCRGCLRACVRDERGRLEACLGRDAVIRHAVPRNHLSIGERSSPVQPKALADSALFRRPLWKILRG